MTYTISDSINPLCTPRKTFSLCFSKVVTKLEIQLVKYQETAQSSKTLVLLRYVITKSVNHKRKMENTDSRIISI